MRMRGAEEGQRGWIYFLAHSRDGYTNKNNLKMSCLNLYIVVGQRVSRRTKKVSR